MTVAKAKEDNFKRDVRGMEQVKRNTWHGLRSFIYNIGK